MESAKKKMERYGPLTRGLNGYDQIRAVQAGPTLRLVLTSGEIVPLSYPEADEIVGRLDASDIGLQRALLGDRILAAIGFS